ncbi:MAG: hypothetical protein QXN05_01830 [Acidilobaceae archaeon]
MSVTSSKHGVYIKISEISKDEESGLYTAILKLSYEDKSYDIKILNLIRAPHRVRARLEEEYLIVSLDDNEGKPLSTCCINMKHIECGCMDCKSLLTPPCPREREK